MKDKISGFLCQALKTADIQLDTPKDKKFGDFSSNIAIISAKKSGRKPRELAEGFKADIEKMDAGRMFSRIEIAGPGFLNFFLNIDFVKGCLSEVLEQNDSFGSSSDGAGRKVLIEFVSANPTGPLHIGHGRWAAIGDSLARIMRACGWDVTTEFYVNNIGRQVNLLIESVKCAMDSKPVPEDGYNGAYIKDVAAEAAEKKPGDLKAFILDTLLSQQKDTLSSLQAEFDSWFFENTLHENGSVDRKSVV